MSIFSFESFSTKLISAFRDQDGTECERTNYQKVNTLLEKIQVNHPEIPVHKDYVRKNFRIDLSGGVTYLASTEFARIFPQTNLQRRGGRRINQVETGDQSRQRTGYNQYSRGANNQPKVDDGVHTFYGVDVTDVSITFTSNEMATLGPSGQRYIYSERDRLGLSRPGRGGRSSYRGGRAGRGGRGGRHGRNGRAIHATDTGNRQDDLSQITATVIPTQVPANAAGSASSQGTRGSTNAGTRFGAGSYNNPPTQP